MSQDLRTTGFGMQPMSVKHEAGANSGYWAHCLLAVCKRMARHCVHRRSNSFHAV